nr:hypothetical protein [Tanacetum cinerariifolium]
MKNLDAFTFGDQFINDISLEDEPGNAMWKLKLSLCISCLCTRNALEVSMDRDNQEALHETLTTSRKRRQDDQYPPSPLPKDSERSKKKKQDSDASTSRNSSKQKQASQSEQPIDDVCIPDVVHISDSKDIGAAHLPKIKTKPGDKDRRHALLISKLKVTYYQYFRLEELILSLWIESEREYDAIIYKDRNDQKKMMKLPEVYKFSDGTLTRILEKLDHMVKDFKLFKYNLGMENRI